MVGMDSSSVFFVLFFKTKVYEADEGNHVSSETHGQAFSDKHFNSETHSQAFSE